VEGIPASFTQGLSDQLIVEDQLLLPAVSEELSKFSFAAPKIYDAGCGNGRFAKWLSGQFPGSTLSVCEIDEHELELARQALGASVDARQTNIARGIPYGDGAFDLITLMNVLMWLADPEFKSAVQEVARVLNPNGVALSVNVHTDWMDIRYLPVHQVARPSYLVTASWNNRPVTIWRRPIDRYLELFTEQGLSVSVREIAIPQNPNLPSRYAEKAGVKLYSMFTLRKRG